MSTFTNPYKLRDRVCIDKDASLIGVITGLIWEVDKEPATQVSFMHNGDSKVVWIQEWRLSPTL